MDVIDPSLVKDTGWIDFYHNDNVKLECRKIGAQVTLKGTIRIPGGGHDTTDYEVAIQSARLTELNLLPQYEVTVDYSSADFKSEIVINDNGVYLTGHTGMHYLNNISWIVD